MTKHEWVNVCHSIYKHGGLSSFLGGGGGGAYQRPRALTGSRGMALGQPAVHLASYRSLQSNIYLVHLPEMIIELNFLEMLDKIVLLLRGNLHWIHSTSITSCVSSAPRMDRNRTANPGP